MTTLETLPLLPLPNLVFPNGVLPLRVFEPRYTTMLANCAGEPECFGITLAIQDPNDMANVQPGQIGTTVEVIDFDSLENGILGITCLGVRRFINHSCTQNDNGLWIGQVEYLPKELNEHTLLPEQNRNLGQLLEKFYPRLGEPFTNQPMHFDEVEWVSNRLCELLPLNGTTKEKLLRLDDPAKRLNQLSPLSELVQKVMIDHS